MDEPHTHSPEYATPDLKVLEIGEHFLFHMADVKRSDFFLATPKANYGMAWNPRFLSLPALIQIFFRVARGYYDLVVIHPPHYPGWHPRSFLAVFKFTVLKGHPLIYPSVLFSTFAYHLLRFLPPCPMVAIDMSDHAGLPRHHHYLLDRAKAYFKRELPVDKWQVFYRTGHRSLPSQNFRSKPKWRRRLAKLLPISLATPMSVFESAAHNIGAKKTTDIFFAGQTFATNTVREEGIHQLTALKSQGIKVDIPETHLPIEEFHKRCAQAWLTWSPAGFGWECIRHAEASAAGSLPIINTPAITRHQPMRGGEHCFFYNPDEKDGLQRVIFEALSDKARLKKMAKAAQSHIWRHYTLNALCNHVVQTAFAETDQATAA